MDNSCGSMLGGLTDASPVAASPKSVKHHTSGATGGRSGLKLSRSTDEQKGKLSDSGAKKSPAKPLKASASGKRLRRNLSAEAQVGHSSAELVESEHKTDATGRSAVEALENQTTVVTGQPQSSEKRGSQRITRSSSDLRLVDSDSQQHQPANSDKAAAADLCTETSQNNGSVAALNSVTGLSAFTGVVLQCVHGKRQDFSDVMYVK